EAQRDEEVIPAVGEESVVLEETEQCHVRRDAHDQNATTASRIGRAAKGLAHEVIPQRRREQRRQKHRLEFPREYVRREEEERVPRKSPARKRPGQRERGEKEIAVGVRGELHPRHLPTRRQQPVGGAVTPPGRGELVVLRLADLA